ncbi:MAG TPA: DUF2934 domain-containing protein [Opitutaceae bacterium]
MKATDTRFQKKPAVSSRYAPSHQEISARAEALWLKKGCPQGADDEIWLKAERQLLSAGAEGLGDGKGVLEGLRPAGFESDNIMSDLDELYPSVSGRETTSL